MRLRKIILSGFKSFVDHTVIELPGDLVAIVGPNGCGKSNVIDAVRWVMGEISARHLRGDSMADVIFNGSTARKPVGQASVELQFDNAEGRLGERYAAYSEIAVRRQVSRDGNSSYFLNGTRCRRRDITDLFLGTGLGPRSYAVIEQGMISRIIEARPEELREYLEEVAGISRYKERRRETENRIRHTREHLERLTDVREELDKQLQRLDRQARQAERYKVLKEEERELEGQLLALRWQRHDEEVSACNQSVRQGHTAVEAATADLRAQEAAIERGRERQNEAAELANAAYRGVLDVSATVARTEESIDNLKRQRTQLADALAREEAALAQAEAHRQSDERQHGEVSGELAEAEPRLEALEAGAATARQRYTDAETAMQRWQARWEELASLAQAPSATAHAERARIENLEERLQRATDSEKSLSEELAGVDPNAATARHEAATVAAAQAVEHRAAADRALADARGAVETARNDARAHAEALHGARARQQQLQGTHASLSALQEEALGASDDEAVAWLRAQGLAEADRLAGAIDVQSGWERAVEVVLGARLQSVAGGDPARFVEPLTGFTGAELHLHDARGGATAAAPDALSARVSGPACLAEMLHGARVAESSADAGARLAELGPGEYFVTPDGLRLGRGFIHAPGPEQARDGVLVRAQRLRELEAELAEHADRLASSESALRDAQAAVASSEQSLAAAQEASNEAHRVATAAESEAAEAAREAERLRSRRDRLEKDLAELVTRREADAGELSAARARLGEATQALAQVESDRAEWAERRDATRQELATAREAWQQSRDEAYQLGLRVEGWRTRLRALDESRMRYTQQRGQLERHCEELRGQTGSMDEPIAEAEAALQRALADHTQADGKLREAREKVTGIENEIRAIDEKRLAALAEVDSARGALEQARLAATQASTRRDTINEQVEAAGQTVQALIESLPEEASEQAWTERLEDLARRIGRLGAINLAAIEEHQETAERKQYLDAQHADLEEALATLEAAIVRIDRETRARFKETFEKVNRGIAERFPKLFGGGQAYLQLSGEDLLSAGVSVMAQPPGKRNSTIALLSGGEKALTAVALVFALFDLNPAPFCLLDEVDAPLDDANVGRFSAVVKEMSEHVQMLVVTHNKVTMEVGQQLVGVTMNEPGVSRMVAVDIDAAVAMVGS